MTTRVYRQEVIKAAEGVIEAAERFLDAPCTCATIADQGAICAACLLRERFAMLSDYLRITTVKPEKPVDDQPPVVDEVETPLLPKP